MKSNKQGIYGINVFCGEEIDGAVRDYSNVYIKLIGDKKSSKEYNLFDIRANKTLNSFAQDSVDRFNVKSGQLGKVLIQKK
jgi:hypothetical protein